MYPVFDAFWPLPEALFEGNFCLEELEQEDEAEEVDERKSLSDISDEEYQRRRALLTREQWRNRSAWWPRSRWASNNDLRATNWERENQWAAVGRPQQR